MGAVVADLFEPTSWPRGHDVVLLANVLHDWSASQCAQIAAAAYESLPAGGELIVIEALLHDNGAGPLPSALYSVSMLLGDWRSGKQPTYAEVESCLTSAGFESVREGPACGAFHTAVIGRKA